jgi:hypothetical protein
MKLNEANEIVQAAKQLDGDGGLVISGGKPTSDIRWAGNPSRWDAPMLNIEAAKVICHEELRLGRSMTKEEQTDYIRKICAGEIE